MLLGRLNNPTKSNPHLHLTDDLYAAMGKPARIEFSYNMQTREVLLKPFSFPKGRGYKVSRDVVSVFDWRVSFGKAALRGMPFFGPTQLLFIPDLPNSSTMKAELPETLPPSGQRPVRQARPAFGQGTLNLPAPQPALVVKVAEPEGAIILIAYRNSARAFVVPVDRARAMTITLVDGDGKPIPVEKLINRIFKR